MDGLMQRDVPRDCRTQFVQKRAEVTPVKGGREKKDEGEIRGSDPVKNLHEFRIKSRLIQGLLQSPNEVLPSNNEGNDVILAFIVQQI